MRVSLREQMPYGSEEFYGASEQKHQQAVMEFVRQELPRELSLDIFAIPNGGSRNKLEAQNMKAEGVLSGVLDLFCSVPGGNYHGLFIEMKKPKGGEISLNQIDFINRKRSLNYLAFVCVDWFQAVNLLKWYLSGYLNLVTDNNKYQEYETISLGSLCACGLDLKAQLDGVYPCRIEKPKPNARP
ncbi:putative VRR-NUC domain-containing protein [Serratia phage vB_SmaS_Rovert]|uniref:Putative VRR-NUC domain-containing protein n=1 Tax=Serratia phage vB_SmaS_Rovert TaxID=2777363 RepID=A0A7T3TKY1_9CAUD|nr:putative VRR-NUC domain-containing protein [Serratia phage vB_SmaS_Rovert]QPX75011.1 putative VRR-NUC domain-containing protein [Serratia phage vB_SmaS_Rovert]